MAIVGCGVIMIYGPLLAPEFHFNEQQLKLRKLIGILSLILLSSFNILFYNIWLSYFNIGVLITVTLRTPAGVLIVNWVEQLTKGKEV